MKNKVYIYGLKCPTKNVVRYVGKSKNPKRRYSQHLSHPKASRYENIHLYRWLAKLLRESIKPELIIFEECDNKDWKIKEKKWISKFGLDNLLNMNQGGIEPPDNTGLKWTEEQKENHPAHKRKGKPQWIDIPHPLLGKEHPAKGQKRSKEFCELMSKQRLEKNGMRGVKLSKERVKQIKERVRKPIALIDDNGNILKEYKSQKEATIDLELPKGAVSRVCSGIYNQTKGYKFMYLKS
jgi:group I intron endonuclease